MKISNLRIEEKEEQAFLTADVECGFSESGQLWFSVPTAYKDYLTPDVYDAFLVAALYPAMCYGELIEIDGPVSPKLYKNVTNYVLSIIKDFRPAFDKEIPVSVKGFAHAGKNSELHVGTGFSGGIDSFATIHDRYENETMPDWKIDTLFFFNLGQNGRIDDPLTRKRIESRYRITRDFAADLGLPSILMDSNLFEFYLPEWEYDAGVLCRVAAVLVFQRALKRYYISSACTYGEMIEYHFPGVRHDLASFCDPYILPLLSPEGLDIDLDGAQYKRTEKTELIVDDPLLKKYLNVCVNYGAEYADGTNCGKCSKCRRTLSTLESMGKLEEFAGIFDVRNYKKGRLLDRCRQRVIYRSDCFAHDNIDFAAIKGKPFPPYVIAFICYAPFWLLRLPKRVLRKLKIVK